MLILTPEGCFGECGVSAQREGGDPGQQAGIDAVTDARGVACMKLDVPQPLCRKLDSLSCSRQIPCQQVAVYWNWPHKLQMVAHTSRTRAVQYLWQGGVLGRCHS